jgi:hypothetical protein
MLDCHIVDITSDQRANNVEHGLAAIAGDDGSEAVIGLSSSRRSLHGPAATGAARRGPSRGMVTKLDPAGFRKFAPR